ncbi:MAG: bifunctional diaminohydroxyphosphoribosylaminopyrimidine deaminase/5-amino-6-(5-phosphoribosylamino)uracil reductase RibD [Marinilabiliales bacterium]|nr:MAG: bifunctional diaminohydroxyphosphoribosylaminopyrimidine deaminase/5-amino-6-(5-phosphoribosylamino)uracil reductase RibD [Marinilabiliales bacterium]
MIRCLDLAAKGAGKVAPNPMVGCVIVHNNKIIGEGYHIEFGGPHAEVNAINSVENKELLKSSTLYVNLEPCSHYGKTPPCSDLIVSHKIPRVVICNMDPNAKVSGKGIKKLNNAGIVTEIGICENEGNFLNRRFFTFHKQKKPYIILKWAQSKDGFIDIIRNADTPIGPNWISDEISRVLVHKWRAEEMGILVGTQTVLKDNPSLTVRDWRGNSPIRLVIDKKNILTNDLKVFDNKTETIIFNETIDQKKGKTEWISCNSKDYIKCIDEVCFEKGILSLIVEGGEKLLSSYISSNCWNEARVFVGNRKFNQGVKAPKIELTSGKHHIIGQTNLYIVNS